MPAAATPTRTAAARGESRRSTRTAMNVVARDTNRRCSTRNRQASDWTAAQAATRRARGTSSAPGSSQKPAATSARYGVSPFSDADSMRRPDELAIHTPAITPTVTPKARVIAAALRATAAAPNTHQTTLRRPKPPVPGHSAATRYAVPGG